MVPIEQSADERSFCRSDIEIFVGCSYLSGCELALDESDVRVLEPSTYVALNDRVGRTAQRLRPISLDLHQLHVGVTQQDVVEFQRGAASSFECLVTGLLEVHERR